MTTSDNKPFEIRDPVLGFISLDETEQQVIDSRAMQRLKHIHQLAMTYQVYPGATHKRFEHSLGVMELAGRAFDYIFRSELLSDAIRDSFPELSRDLGYWRRLLRMAALCHDLGHLPFSHASEELLPDGWDHERLTCEIVHSAEMASIWESGLPKIDAATVAKLAVGPEKYRRYDPDADSSPWESLLSRIITDDFLGVDRMDYLIRDSHHLGVKYGIMDVERLLHSLRVIMTPPDGLDDQTDPEDDVPIDSIDSSGLAGNPTIGISEGGLYAVEGLLTARYSMFSQVYFHKTRVAYDIHLTDFLRERSESGSYPTCTERLLEDTDNVVLTELSRAATDADARGHQAASTIVNRDHFRLLHTAPPAEMRRDDGRRFNELKCECEKKFGDDVRSDIKTVRIPDRDVPIVRRDGSAGWFKNESELARNLPESRTGFIFVRPKRLKEARRWVQSRGPSAVDNN